MNLEFFIAKRIGVASKNSFSKAILRLAVVAVALSMVVMIIATAIVAGFKHTISDKIFGFWGHIHITNNYAPSSYAFEGSPMNQTQDFYPAIDTTQQILYRTETIDWLPTLALNMGQPLVWLALLFTLLGLLPWVMPQKWRKNWRLGSRLWISLLASALAVAFFVAQPYDIIQKDEVVQTKGGIRHIQLYIHKEGIIKTKDQIEGIILRGVGMDYDWDFLSQYLKSGDILETNSEKVKRGILISETTALRLKLKVGDQFLIYFVQEGTSIGRKFKVRGIYKTGLEEYDQRFALVDVRTLQRLNNWRPYRNYGTELDLEEERVSLKGITTGTAPNEGGWQYVQQNLTAGELINLEDPETNEAVIPEHLAQQRQLGLGDTILMHYRDASNDIYQFRYAIKGIYKAPADRNIKTTVFVHWNSINRLNEGLPPQISGFEIFVENLDDLDAFGDHVNYVTLLGKEQYANTIKELELNIFNWLSLTDMNERIILILMLLVSIINMTTSLMILILERTNMIGILKAMGAQNWSIRKVFLYNAAYIIGYGLFWGNVIGLLLCWIQLEFGVITLPEDMYYVPVAPVELNFFTILALNIGTLTITLSVLLIPSWLVAKIDPVKAIRFS